MYNINEEYAKKSMKELRDIKIRFQEAVSNHPQVKLFNEHLQYVNMVIAERIGKRFNKRG